MYASGLTSLQTTLKSKTSDTINSANVIALILNGSLWVAYGYALNNYAIMAPNAAGVALSLIQVALLCIYPRSTKGYEGAKRESVLNDDITCKEGVCSPIFDTDLKYVIIPCCYTIAIVLHDYIK